MPALQEGFFSPGVACYNETFCPATESSKENPNYFYLWNESICTREAPDVASAFWKLLEDLDAKAQKEKKSGIHLTIWLDNCVPQVYSIYSLTIKLYFLMFYCALHLCSKKTGRYGVL